MLPLSPQKSPAFEGLVPDERKRFGWLNGLSSTPNLLRLVGTSPTVAVARPVGRAFDIGVRNAKLGLEP